MARQAQSSECEVGKPTVPKGLTGLLRARHASGTVGLPTLL